MLCIHTHTGLTQPQLTLHRTSPHRLQSDGTSVEFGVTGAANKLVPFLSPSTTFTKPRRNFLIISRIFVPFSRLCGQSHFQRGGGCNEPHSTAMSYLYSSTNHWLYQSFWNYRTFESSPFIHVSIACSLYITPVLSCSDFKPLWTCLCVFVWLDCLEHCLSVSLHLITVVQLLCEPIVRTVPILYSGFVLLVDPVPLPDLSLWLRVSVDSLFDSDLIRFSFVSIWFSFRLHLLCR